MTSLKEEVKEVKDLETFGPFESDTSKSAIVASGGLCVTWPWWVSRIYFYPSARHFSLVCHSWRITQWTSCVTRHTLFFFFSFSFSCWYAVVLFGVSFGLSNVYEHHENCRPFIQIRNLMNKPVYFPSKLSIDFKSCASLRPSSRLWAIIKVLFWPSDKGNSY